MARSQRDSASRRPASRRAALWSRPTGVRERLRQAPSSRLTSGPLAYIWSRRLGELRLLTRVARARPAQPRSDGFDSVRVLVFAPAAGFGGVGLWGSGERKAVVRRDERVGGRHRVHVVDITIFARQGGPG